MEGEEGTAVEESKEATPAQHSTAELSGRRFTFIKMVSVGSGKKKRRRLRLKWLEPHVDDFDETVKTYVDPPNEEFTNTLEVFHKYVVPYVAKGLHPRIVMGGIEFKYDNKGGRTVTVSAFVNRDEHPQGVPLNLNHLAPTGEMVKEIEDLEYCAEQFIQGDRGQLEIDLEGEVDDPEQTLGLDE